MLGWEAASRGLGVSSAAAQGVSTPASRPGAVLSIVEFGALGDGSGATISEWLKGGSHDRNYADLAAIKEDYPEVTNAGWTIDDAALARALAVALETGNDLLLPSGIYVRDPEAAAIVVKVNDGRSIHVFGAGPNSVIMRKTGSTTSDYKELLAFESDQGGARRIEVSNLRVDSNARGNPIPENGSRSYHEHCHDLVVRPRAGSPAGVACFHDLDFFDGMGDHISVASADQASLTVETLVCYNIVESHRERSRACIIWYGGCHVVAIANVRAYSIETEFGEAAARIEHDMHVLLSNVHVEQLDVAAWPDISRKVFWRVDNLVAASHTTLAYISGILTNCDLTIRRDGRILKPGDLRFVDCKIRVPYEPAINEVTGLQVHFVDGFDHVVEFHRCHFTVDADSSVETPLGPAITSFGAVGMDWAGEQTTRFVECTFDPRFERCLDIIRGGTVLTERCRFAARSQAVTLRDQPDPPSRSRWVSKDDNFSAVAGPGKFVLGATYKGQSRIELHHFGIDEQDAGFAVDANKWDGGTHLSTRLILVDEAPPAGGIAGDRARRRIPEAGQPFEWVCTKTHPSLAHWSLISAIPKELTSDSTTYGKQEAAN